MAPHLCPICGQPMEYGGIEDGGGDYGDSACDTWDCLDCDYQEESDCVEYDDDGETEMLPFAFDDLDGLPF